ncbi:ferredoxin family protein [Streptomyces sp. NA02950]|uniref:4Fe-4S dicluster domain-containing protein n=1 Tax=Streptomyces sp. NA02950 TaxID=2742137 RepID=UPI00159261E2|nr:ferredoxin family protein [Streptomyces sp. NA02950]QKV90816.1 ferredoxin family protein [Streptomyces sp. NA02950]
MIELVSAERCIACDKCVAVCPTNVFDRGPDGIPLLSRQEDCQTCFQCEANCPVDALFVAPVTHPLPDDQAVRDEGHLRRTGLLGSYRRHIGWGRGRTPAPLRAVGPPLPAPGAARPSPPITS